MRRRLASTQRGEDGALRRHVKRARSAERGTVGQGSHQGPPRHGDVADCSSSWSRGQHRSRDEGRSWPGRGKTAANAERGWRSPARALV
ncbi:proline-rich receptor-like protein kinase PERK2 [Iris pallida]|uniref:Proline-rich receptor-like protein kinase PERK2 n=1 Tax=Iris pallida TaxID=29817 RepID=A0AAX6EC18_IRIPA|nr:proline-rich receptor-like protein kinase PERK2 [Iris pallida]